MDWRAEAAKIANDVRRRNERRAAKEDEKFQKSIKKYQQKERAKNARKLEAHGRRFRCGSCGKPSQEYGSRVHEEMVAATEESGPMHKDMLPTIDFTTPGDRKKCNNCGRWTCYDHLENGICMRCAQRRGSAFMGQYVQKAKNRRELEAPRLPTRDSLTVAPRETERGPAYKAQEPFLASILRPDEILKWSGQVGLMYKDRLIITSKRIISVHGSTLTVLQLSEIDTVNVSYRYLPVLSVTARGTTHRIEFRKPEEAEDKARVIGELLIRR